MNLTHEELGEFGADVGVPLLGLFDELFEALVVLAGVEFVSDFSTRSASSKTSLVAAISAQ